jgi:hypothetical protein
MPAQLTCLLLLVASNVFMTFAWYGHLKFKHVPIITVIVISWLIALPEYLLQVPANRIGHQVFSAAQLKMAQEIITLLVFAAFSVWYLNEPLKWNHLVAFACLLAGGYFMFYQS